MKLLIYAANLHVGGGVQVASSVISELAKCGRELCDVTVWASSAVDGNLKELGVQTSGFAGYEVIDHRGAKARWSAERSRVPSYDGVFVVFGPHYLGSLGRTGPAIVMGFAQSWIIYPDNEVYGLLTLLQRWRTRLRFLLQAMLFRRADWLVVELEHVREGLIHRGIAPPDRIAVVPNCVASVFLTPALWQPVHLPPRRARVRLGFVGRNYVHKNTRVFPAVLRMLRQRYLLDVEMLVTFTPTEWNVCDEDFRSSVVNVGELTVGQCPTFYQSLDAVVFPSLLESFSATPLEAMVMERPLFASDRSFVRDICGSFAEYFDPMNPDNIAQVIAAGLGQVPNAHRRMLARQHALEFSSANRRATTYLKLLRKATIMRINTRSPKDV